MAFVLHYLRSNDLFLDIGANVGSYTVLAAAVCGANALSVEPVPSTFKDLRDNVRINDCEERCRLANVALSDEEGELQFTADLDAMNHVAQPGETTREIFSCPVRRLDDLVGETAPNFMKLDVEGYESKVLDGAPRTLEKLQAIIIELNGGGSRYGVRDEEVASRLLRVGFLPHTYRPATRELVPTAQASTGGNTIFLRDPADAQARVRSGPERSVYGRTI
jgi:FkbM family methyltransferase